MARATTCQLDDRRIDITEALALRTQGRKQAREALDFRCIQCGNPEAYKGYRGRSSALRFTKTELFVIGMTCQEKPV